MLDIEIKVIELMTCADCNGRCAINLDSAFKINSWDHPEEF